MTFDAEFFVTIAFLLFLTGMIYLGVHKQVTGALDARVKRIVDELGEAKSLREEAASLLASFEQKRVAAEAEAAAIVAQARVEAELLAKESEQRITDFIARRTKQADAKIAMAETQASNDVRASAADAAVQAAGVVLQSYAKGPAGASFIEKSIGDLKSLMN